MKQERMAGTGDWSEVLRILEDLEVHHTGRGRERFWTPQESYNLWRAIYDAISTTETDSEV